MKKSGIVGGACFVVFMVAVLFSGGVSQEMGVIERPASAIGAQVIDLTGEQLLSPDLIRAFVETGSASEKCLVTLREASPDARIIQSVFCAHRIFNGKHGILITVLLAAPPDPAGFVVGLTVYQEFARGYRAPLLYTGD